MVNYDPHRWTDHFFDIQGSLIREVVGRVLLCGVWAAAVVYFHRHVHPVGTSSTVHSLVGVALGLLLVFRTNASYDRFWEGRKLWGGIVNECRNLVRGCSAFLRDAPQARQEISQWLIAFPYAAMHQLRGSRGIGPVSSSLNPQEVEVVLSSNHPPLAVASRISGILQDAKKKGLITEFAQANLDQNIQLLVDYLGGCERIHKTPLPFAYVVHLRRALIVYCLSLPFALVDSFGWTTVIDVVFVAFVFFGIEEIGVEIEDPFGDDENDLPLEAICATIQGNIEGLK